MNEEQSEETVGEAVSSLSSQVGVPLAFNEGRLLEVLSQVLKGYLSQPDIQMVLDDLRSELYTGLNMGSLKTLHSITKNCRKCPELEPDPQLPAWNKANPDCLFILEFPPSDSQVIYFLIQVLKGVGFSADRIGLTYLNRCKATPLRKASLEEITNCSSYLFTEIQLMRPKLIVCMGVVPASLLLGTLIKMHDERGKILWLGPWAIMPTYSPSFAVAGAEYIQKYFSQDLLTAYEYCYGKMD